MTKKLTKHGNSLALIIDKPILEMLKISEKTALELVIQGNELVIRRKSGKILKKRNSDDDINTIAQRIMDKYGPVFKRLAKE